MAFTSRSSSAILLCFILWDFSLTDSLEQVEVVGKVTCAEANIDKNGMTASSTLIRGCDWCLLHVSDDTKVVKRRCISNGAVKRLFGSIETALACRHGVFDNSDGTLCVCRTSDNCNELSVEQMRSVLLDYK
ncbi:hypothetical protein M514_14711 [Trichuris suis]|uniref:Uncharacterized protein n=1 Tax=Trichuris suis TaxID=68888 RepID=A0A085MBB2_9BILA|nr:hypothetical protein M513_04654 [Trichuris suis]KFD54508.1 hypothetical protein M513_04655 [Trichuris suis]KFD73371.1 hypothetical protein M514_14711 [Trichuris suis]KHJ45429.1 hypothetical protein D918_04166 [Trichuris suis]